MKEIDIQIKFNRNFFFGGGKRKRNSDWKQRDKDIYIISIIISKIIQKIILSFLLQFGIASLNLNMIPMQRFTLKMHIVMLLLLRILTVFN